MTVYGIRAETYQDGKWVTVTTMQDVSTDKAFVIDLARRCNKYELSPIHLLDVVMDELP